MSPSVAPDARPLIFDLDGTLLVGEDLSDANRTAVRRASDAGHPIVIATARWREMALKVAEEIGLTNDPVIACSGAQVYDRTRQADVFDERLPADFTSELFALCDAQRCIATVTFGERVLLKLDGEPDPKLMGPEMQWVPALTGNAPDAPRIAAVQGSKACALIRQELEPRFAEHVNIFDSVGPTGRLILTITGKRATKGAAVDALCSHLSVRAEDAIAFGDAENDVAMFDACGTSVAMGQADESVKARATFVTATHTEDGVAQAINRLLETGSPAP